MMLLYPKPGSGSLIARLTITLPMMASLTSGSLKPLEDLSLICLHAQKLTLLDPTSPGPMDALEATGTYSYYVIGTPVPQG